LAIVCSLALSVVLAQQNSRPPGGAGQPAGGNPQAQPGAAALQPGNGLPALGAAQVRPAQPAAADEATFRQQVSYVFGRQMGDGLRENQIPVDLPSLFAGLEEGLKNAPPKWSKEQLTAAMERFEKEMEQKNAVRRNEAMAKNKREQDAFLAQNRTQQGVQVTPSGLQYKVLKAGNGPSPTRNDAVVCHYRGVLLSGQEFDSSYGRGEPSRFMVGGVIPGWTEALQKMKVGDKWQLFVPSELAYGADPDPRSGIEPGAMLVFEVELLEILRQ
jgi:FKBP-type peptidyl-prolyl cis-trans isomerase